MNRASPPRLGVLASVAILCIGSGTAPSIASSIAPIPTSSPVAMLAQATPAQTEPAPDQRAAPAPPQRMREAEPRRGARKALSSAELVEARIEDLHKRLHITPAQDAQWTKVAEVMRDNAKAVEAAALQRQQSSKTMTAVDNLRSYQALAAAHAEGLGKLVAAFGPLYDEMNGEQKRVADAVFRRKGQQPPQRSR